MTPDTAKYLKSCIVIAALLVASAVPAWADDDPDPAAPAPAAAQAPGDSTGVTANIPVRFFANVHLREDFTKPEDRLDLLLDPDSVYGFVARLRFGMELGNATSSVAGGLRVSAGQSPNPTSPFVRLGDAYRPVTFGIDQFYIDVRPFENKRRAHAVFGKMPNPFWRGDKGVIRAEMTWDDDVSPVGGIGQIRFIDNGDVVVQNTLGWFIVQWFRQNRFAGLVGDTALTNDEIKVQLKRITFAATYSHWENLNSGLLVPSFVPGQTVDLVPGQSAFLLRTGFQLTNAELDLGSGAHAYRSEVFNLVEFMGQGTAPIELPFFGKSELVGLAHYAQNLSFDDENKGISLTGGFVGGDYNQRIKPFSYHFTWRRVEADAAIAAFADSDLGAGTDFKGFEITGEQRVHRNLALTASFFNFDGAPHRSLNVKRTFIGLILDF